MSPEHSTGQLSTHTVENQPPLLVNFNRYTSDPILQAALKDQGTAWAEDELKNLGAFLGKEETIHLGLLANDNTPKLHTHDRQGRRVDFVEFHPAYHQLFTQTVKYGIHTMPWSQPRKGAHVARAAMHYLAYQVEQGHICPTTMTYGCVPALKRQKEVADVWLEKVYSREYDPSFGPVEKKTGAIIGMAMTEKQGGSDVRSNTTRAKAVGQPGPGREYLLTGHKWFCSAPMSDAFLVLAQTDKGPSCFFVPRWLPDGKKNNIFIQRLKNKLGDRSNASSEIELLDTWGLLIGEEGRGVPIIIEMANYTRLDCAIAGSSIMRWGTAEAIHHAKYRAAFGAKLIDQPIMQRVLADLAIEAEAAIRLTLRLAKAYDQQDDEYESHFRRISTAIAKYWLTKRSVTHIYESMEVLAGNGFVEESHFPRHYRQAPLNSIWEGSGNVMCLDVLRAMQKEPRTAEVLMTELAPIKGKNAHLDRLLGHIQKAFAKPDDLLAQSRWLVEKLALALQAKLMLESAPAEIAEIFCENRLSEHGVNTFGALRGHADYKAIATRSAPRV